MHTRPRLSKSGVELVKRFEGLRRSAAQLPGGGWTIGYGHTASARQGAEVSAEDAEALLLYDLRKVAQAVDEAVFTPLNQNQFDAIAAFAFNVGVDNFLGSKVLKRLNEGSYLQAAAAIEMWRRADIQGDSIVVDALVRRRAAEKALFLTPPEGFRPAPTPVVRPEYDIAPELAATQRGLADAAEVDVPMQGEVAHAQVAASPVVEPEAPPVAGSPLAEASRSVAARLNQILSADAPAEAVATTPAAEPEDEGQAEPPPFAEAPSAGQPPQPRIDAPPAAPAAVEAVAQAEAAFPDARRRPAAQPVELEAPRSSLSLGAVALGVFGAALFCGALATMVFGRATLVNLALGLIGIACMVPTVLKLLTRLFSGRSSAEADPWA